MDILKLRIEKMKNGNALELVVDKLGAGSDKVNATEKHEALIHNDLYNAIQALTPHLALMAFHVKESEVDDIASAGAGQFENFSVGSYSISGKDEKRGIIISGTLRKAGRAHNFNTPFYRFEEPAASRYYFMDDLVARLKHIEAEVTQYLDGTKRGEPIQGELGLGEKVTAEGNAVSDKDKHKYADKDAMSRVAEMDNGKKKGKKKVPQSAVAPSGEVVE